MNAPAPAALDIASGQVLTRCRPRHRHQEFLAFLKDIEANVPPELDIHLVVDNYATHKHERVRRWLAARPRYHVHYTPTYSSWLNQVELWFAKIQRDVIRRGVFTSVADLGNKLRKYIRAYSKSAKPFRWTYTDSTRRIIPNKITGTAY